MTCYGASDNYRASACNFTMLVGPSRAGFVSKRMDISSQFNDMVWYHSSFRAAPPLQQQAQLMLTNPRDAFSSQSRSPNIVPFHMLGIVSSCAIVTLSLRGAVFTIFDFKRCHDLEIGARGMPTSLKVAPFERLYGFLKFPKVPMVY